MFQTNLSSKSLYGNWTPVTVQEMKAFVAVILNMGIIKIPDLKDYWSTNIVLNIPFFHSVFSRNQFFQIFGTLHIGIALKIQPFMDIILPNINKISLCSKPAGGHR